MTPLRTLLRLIETAHNVPSDKNKLNRAIIRLGGLTALATTVLLLLLARGSATTQASSFGQRLANSTRYVAGKLGWALIGTINGMVFRDFNGNGTLSSGSEPGVSGVTVTVYDGAGNRCTATTANDGTYAINTASCVATPAANLTAGPYRVEFSNLPAGFESSAVGASSGTTVQFINDGGGQANLAIHVPSEYSQNQPDAVTNCYVNGDTNLTTPTVGDAEAGALDVLVKFPYQPVAASGANTYLAKGNVMGMTWGLAYQRASKFVFSGAFMKRHSSFGPNGPGALYKTDLSGATPATSVFLDLDAAPFNYNFGADPHSGLPVNPATPNHDPNSFDAVGKVGIGDVDLSEDEKTLWLVNLNDRHLYEIAVGNPAVAPTTTSAIKRHDLVAGFNTLPNSSACTAGFRPWALAVKDGYVYVGGVCQDASRAWIMRHSATGALGSFESVYDFSLAYTKGPVTRDGATADNGDWRAWRATWSAIVNPAPGAAALGETIQPQPILSDIEFDVDGSLMLGFIDRMGHQGGYNNYGTDTTSTTAYLTASGGELLRVCRVGNAYVMQGQAGCANNLNNNQGPGGGEYYFFDYHNQVHEEVVVGGLAFRPGSGSVLATRHGGGGGVRWFSNATGSSDDEYQIYGTLDLGTYGKAAGLGDVEYLRDQTPIELGNRLWMDVNHNGMQDPNEMALANVTVRLYKVGNATALATARTDANGQYIFSNDPRGYGTTGNSAPNDTASNGGFNSGDVQGGRASTASHRYGILGLMPGMSYEIRFDDAADYTGANALAGKTPTTKDASANAADQRDSDVMLPNPGAPIGVGNYPFIAVTLGADDAGRNNHTLDAGFHVCAPITITPTTLTGVGVGQTVNQQLTAMGGTAPYTFSLAQGSTLPPTLMLSGAGLLSGTVTSGTPTTFTVQVTDNDRCTGSITYTFSPNCPAIAVNPNPLPNGTVGVAYSQTLTASGGSGPYTFVVNGSLPNGLMQSGNTISGTPTSAAAASFSITATDNNGCRGTTNFTITPACNASYAVSPTTLPTATVGTFFSQQFSVPGAQVPLTWSTTGTLPAGLTFNAANATLSGTPTSTTARTFTVNAMYGGTCVASQQFTLQPLCNTNLAVNPAVLAMTVGVSFTQQFTLANATGAITWLQTGTLPAGLTFDAATGTLSGTPTSTTQVTFRIRGTDANGCMAARDYTVAPACNTNLAINPTALPGAYLGVPYSQTLTVMGASGNVTWMVNAGSSLPAWLSLSAAGVLNGTPTATGSFTFTIKATDANGCMGTREFALVVSPVFSLGNRVYKDYDDSGTNNNNEPGVNGVVVRLLTSGGAIAQDINGNNIAPRTTANGGYYRFDLLPAGDYLVEIAASNFIGSGALVGCVSSSRDAGDPDVDVDDSDDNGIGQTPSTTDGIRSAAVTLGPNAGSEPTNETDRTASDPVEPNGNTNLTVDFAFTPLMNLGNLVWKDLNNNGQRDAGEPGVDGVQLDLYLDRDNNGVFSSGDSPALGPTFTANGGSYNFPNLLPGRYIINVPNTNFQGANRLVGCLSSTVSDASPDNNQDNDDNGLDDSTPAVNGIASRAITLSGFGEPTTDGDGNNGNLTLDFGFYTPVSLGNLVWKDLNNNGSRDNGEPGVDTVLVELLRDSDNSGALNGTELTTVIATRVTAGGGLYQFTNLSPGHYFVRIAAANFNGTAALVGCVSSVVTDATPNNDEDNDDNGLDNAAPATNGILSGLITLASGGEPPAGVDGDGVDSNATVDFGFFAPVSLGNLVWKDLDNNGTRNGEPVINGVKLELFRDVNGNNQLDAGDGAMLAMTTTVNGLYNFANLTPGTYFVRVAASNFASGGALFECVSSTVTQANANSDTDNDDNGIDNADPLANGITSGVIILQAGTEPDTNVDGDGRNANQTIDFGFVSATQSLGNLVWKDANRNGRRDGEPGIGGVKLNLYRDNGDNTFNAANDALVAMTTTDGAGNYRFGNLITGRYFVQVDRSNFMSGGALNGCISSSGTVAPNTDIEDDDNGSDGLNPATNPPVSGVIILTTNSEPPAGVDGDGTNGNNTIDFGFVNLLNIAVHATAGCVGPGGILELSATLTNPTATNQPDNAGPEFEVALPAALVALANSCTATSGACTVVNGGTVRWNGALAGNASVTIRYRVQAANNLSTSAPVCYTTTAFFDADNNGSNETATSVDNCVQATCPPAGPGEPVPGCSVLIYPVYTSNATNPARGNTRISITNTSQNQQATMHLFFVDGEYCTVADSFLCLTPNQTTSFLMSDLDPGTTGYLIAVAVDPTTGCPAYFNYLLGDEFVKFESGHYANLKAECAQALPGGDFTCDGNNQFATLRFDGMQYSRLPRVVAVDNLPSPADGNETRLYLSRIGGNLAGNVAALGDIFGLAYDDAERSYSFGGVIGTCQLRTMLNGSFPRTSPRLDTVISSGRSGWLKLWTVNEGALVGAVLNRNANSAQANAFDGGHNLHTLRLAESASLQIPLFPGVCR
jgi:hypothetical protein